MITFSDKQAAFILKPFNHLIDWNEGSPRSGKTFAGLMRYARHLIISRDPVHLVVGYSSQQAYRLAIEGEGHGLKDIFRGACEVKRDDSGDYLQIKTPGECPIKKVYWKGGGKADSHKAITGMSLGSVYFCEINLIHLDMIQECLRRTWAARDRWCLADLNPPAPRHPVITQILDIQDCDFEHWTPRDNPILTPERLKEIEETCRKSPFLYKRDWLGERAIPEGVIYWMLDPGRHVLERMPENVEPREMYFSGDGGTTDATSISCNVVGVLPDKTPVLYRIATWRYDGGAMAMSEQAREIVQKFIPYCRLKTGMRESTILIDPACKALRLEIERLGLRTTVADNNARDVKGSVKGIKCGIEMAQSLIQDGHFYIVDDSTYPHDGFLQEAGLYCVDKNGSPVDKYNHSMDEFRYACNHFAKRYGLWGGGVTVKQKPAGL